MSKNRLDTNMLRVHLFSVSSPLRRRCSLTHRQLNGVYNDEKCCLTIE